MSYFACADDAIVETYYASALLRRLAEGCDDPDVVHLACDDPQVLRTTLKRATPEEIEEIARDCDAKAVDVAQDAHLDADQPGFSEEWSALLRRTATELRSTRPRGRAALK